MILTKEVQVPLLFRVLSMTFYQIYEAYTQLWQIKLHVLSLTIRQWSESIQFLQVRKLLSYKEFLCM